MDLSFDESTSARTMWRALTGSTADSSLDLGNLTFAFGLKGSQSGILTAGYSETPGVTMGYGVTKVASDGTTILGSTGVSETFIAPNPHLVLNQNGTLSTTLVLSGTVFTPQYGVIMTEFGGGKTTKLHFVNAGIAAQDLISGDLPVVDEIVLRFSGNGDSVMGSVSVLGEPHFVYTQNGTKETYASSLNNLKVNGDSNFLSSVEYALFVPASVVGKSFSAMVGAKAVADPALGDEMTPDGRLVNLPFTWTMNPAWIDNSAGNAGLYAVLDRIAGTTPSTRSASAKWKKLAQYFQKYFMKFYQSGATMFNSKDGLLPSGFVMIGLETPLKIGPGKVVSIGFEPGTSQIAIANGAMEITGTPPLKIVATVQ
jgi:hypothetical protein